MPGAHDGLGVDPGAAHAGHVVEAEPVEPLHHQHPGRDEGGVGAGDHVAPLAELGERAGDVEHVLGLEPEVELLGDGLGEQLDQGRRVGERGDGDAADQLGRQPRHDPQVVADEPGDGGPLHLDHDLLAGAQGGGVHLGDRRRRQRACGRPSGRPPRAGGPRSASTTSRTTRNGSGGTWSRQQLELADQLGGEDALARADDLAELDVGGAERARPPAAAGARCRPGSPSRRCASRAAPTAPTARAQATRSRWPAGPRGASGRAVVSSGTSATDPGAHLGEARARRERRDRRASRGACR